MKYIGFLIVGGIIGASAVFVIQSSTSKQQDQAQLTGPVRYNCELSGGAFKNGDCSCPLEPNQTQEETYDESTGFCQASIGGPGGSAFQASIGLPWGDYGYYQGIIIDLCEESGGGISGAACICPEPKTYDKTNGQCK